MQLGHTAVRVLLAVRQMDPRREVQLQVCPDRVQPDLPVVFSGQPVIASHRQHLRGKANTTQLVQHEPTEPRAIITVRAHKIQ